MGFTKAQAPDCYNCKFRICCFFISLEPKLQKAWNDAKVSKNLKNEEVIINQGDAPEGIYVVCKGRVKIISSDSMGQQMIYKVKHPGELFGHVGFFSCQSHICNAEGMGDTLVSLITGNTILNFLKEYPSLNLLMLKTVSLEIQNLYRKLKDALHKPAKVRLADTLIKSISFRSKDSPTPTIYGLKRTELADITGLALETVVRTLASFEKKKIIRREAKAIKILDINALKKIARH